VPAIDVRRRFRRSIDNFFKIYEPLLDTWILYDNSGPEPILVAEKIVDNLSIKDENLFKKVSKGNRNDK